MHGGYSCAFYHILSWNAHQDTDNILIYFSFVYLDSPLVVHVEAALTSRYRHVPHETGLERRLVIMSYRSVGVDV